MGTPLRTSRAGVSRNTDGAACSEAGASASGCRRICICFPCPKTVAATNIPTKPNCRDFPIPLSPWTRSFSTRSGFFQLGIPLHQLLQTEARELYRNLGVFPIAFALIDRPFPIFRMLHLLPRTESPSAFRLLRRHFRNIELLPA